MPQRQHIHILSLQPQPHPQPHPHPQPQPLSLSILPVHPAALGQDEFRTVLDATLAMQQLDPAAINRVLHSPHGADADGVTYNAFRYFASLTSETILACCGFCLHVRNFCVTSA